MSKNNGILIACRALDGALPNTIANNVSGTTPVRLETGTKTSQNQSPVAFGQFSFGEKYLKFYRNIPHASEQPPVSFWGSVYKLYSASTLTLFATGIG